ncbi:MAG: 50S ribosomal protein L10 [Eubacteriales bacterium]|nr:50S ribosomal protein L10 [Eubacteriales bacterium]
MSKVTQTKAEVIEEIKEKLAASQGTVLINYTGINVQEVTDMRAKFRAAGVEYKVYKNTLIHRAANELGIEGLADYLHGSTAVAFCKDDPITAPKAVLSYIEKAKKMEVKCGLLGTEVLDAKAVEDLSKLPAKEVVVAQLLGVMNGPIRNFVSVLNGPARSLVYALQAIADQKGA